MSNYDFQRLNARTEVVVSTYQAVPACNPFGIRFLVQNVNVLPNQIEQFAQMGESLSVDFDEYYVLGVTISDEVPPGTDILGTIATAGTRIVDVVFSVRDSNFFWASEDDITNRARDALVKAGMGSPAVKVLNYPVVYGNCPTFHSRADEPWLSGVAGFWMAKEPSPIFIYSNGQYIATTTFNDGRMKKLFGSDNRSVARGFSDWPEALSPLYEIGATPDKKDAPPPPVPVDPTTGEPTTPGGKLNTFLKKTSSGQAVLMGGSSTDWLILGVFALVGYTFYNSFKGGRRG